VLGEPPDEEEERAGSAFAGPAGQLMDNMLRALKLRRSTGEAAEPAKQAYLTNVVKCRPAVVRIPQPQELLACEPFLQREIALVKPKVILAMGRFAAQALLQGSQPEAATLPLGKLRGQTYHYQGVPVIVTYHPSYLLRSQADKARAWLDLCRARALALAAAAPGSASRSA
jgi:DNA polymerase